MDFATILTNKPISFGKNPILVRKGGKKTTFIILTRIRISTLYKETS